MVQAALDAFAFEDAGSHEVKDEAAGFQAECGVGQEGGSAGAEDVGEAEGGAEDGGSGLGGGVQEGSGGGQEGGGGVGVVAEADGQSEKGSGLVGETDAGLAEDAVEGLFGAVFGVVVAADVGHPARGVTEAKGC